MRAMQAIPVSLHRILVSLHRILVSLHSTLVSLKSTLVAKGYIMLLAVSFILGLGFSGLLKFKA